MGIGIDKAKATDLPLWLEETGPTSCPGANNSSLTNARPNMLGLRLLVSSIGGSFTKTTVKGGANMSVYTVVKNEGKTLVTTVINANDAAKISGNPVSVTMPKGSLWALPRRVRRQTLPTTP